jgi:hypothetical protein
LRALERALGTRCVPAARSGPRASWAPTPCFFGAYFVRFVVCCGCRRVWSQLKGILGTFPASSRPAPPSHRNPFHPPVQVPFSFPPPSTKHIPCLEGPFLHSVVSSSSSVRDDSQETARHTFALLSRARRVAENPAFGPANVQVVYCFKHMKNIHKALNNNSGDSVERDRPRRRTSARGGHQERREKQGCKSLFFLCVRREELSVFLCLPFLLPLSVLSKKKTSFQRPTKRLRQRVAQRVVADPPFPTRSRE